MKYLSNLNKDNLISIREFKNRDTFWVTYHEPMIMGENSLELTRRQCEELELIEKTARLRYKSDKQYSKELLRLRAYQITRSIILLLILIYAIDTQNVAGTGIFAGLFFCSVLIPILNPSYPDVHYYGK